MLRFVSRRVAFTLVICVLIVFFAYLGMRMVQNSERLAPDYDMVRHAVRAWQDVRAFFSGRMTLLDGKLLLEAYVNSMGLLLVALATAGLIGLCIGGVAALTKRPGLVQPLLVLTIVGISVPSFLAGVLLRLGELKYLAVFGQRLVSMAGFGWDFQHMLMPVMVLAARPVAYVTRAVYVSLSQIMERDFVRTAFAKGLPTRRIVGEHALRNIAVPILTALGVSVRFSLSTLPIVEVFFVWPGMGVRLLQAIDARQTDVVVALALALGATFLAINLALDVAYRLVDPRVRDA
jgi:peptide/nickel transport system permease protein